MRVLIQKDTQLLDYQRNVNFNFSAMPMTVLMKEVRTLLHHGGRNEHNCCGKLTASIMMKIIYSVSQQFNF